jgi:hypothetical protein
VPLFTKNVDDVGEIGLGRPGDHVRRGRAIMAHPHVERAAQAKREAAIGLVELHRGHPDIHRDAVDRCDALRGANLSEVGESVLNQREPAARLVDQIESGRYRGPVAVDADDTGARGVEDGPAITAGAKGGIDIDAAVAGTKQLDRLAAKNGNMARGSRIHAPAPGAVSAKLRKLDANRPIAPQISRLRRTFRLENPFLVKRPRRGAIADPAGP